jgi:hypothetical protein
MTTDKDLLDWFEFVATKFQNSRDGWVYTRDLGDLEHMRYRSDHTGYYHWTRRLRRLFNLKRAFGLDSFSRQIGIKNRSIKDFWGHLSAHVVVAMALDNNLPDGRIANASIYTSWEEDGEYITLMGPTVGVKVLEFLKAEPENPHAKAILAEMHRVKELSWPDKKEN